MLSGMAHCRLMATGEQMPQPPSGDEAVSSDNLSFTDFAIQGNPTDVSRREAGEGDDLRYYFNQIGKTALLPEGDDKVLAKRIEAGLYAAEKLRTAEDAEQQLPVELMDDLQWIAVDGEHAKDHLIRANTRLVVSIAKRYRERGMPFLDLIQEGNIALIHAVEKYDYTHGAAFTSYATTWIHKKIREAIQWHGRTIRLPVHVHEEIFHMAKHRREITAKKRSAATPEEIAEAMGVEVTKVVELLGYDQGIASLDKRVGKGEDTELGAFVEDKVIRRSEDTIIEALEPTVQSRMGALSLLDELDPMTAEIIRLRAGLEDGSIWTQQRVAEKLGRTRQAVSRREIRGLAKLRELAEQAGYGSVEKPPPEISE